jgi:3-oxoadipate enol-lactonase
VPHANSGTASIYYERFGEGPALVLAHGAGGNSLSWWQQVPVFARRFSVVVFDHRGFGRSTCPAADLHPKHFDGDLLAVLDALGVERAALVCQSMGGWTGLRTALRHPERVRSLALCGTPGGLALPEVLESARQMGERIAREGIRGNAALAPDYPARRPDMAFLYERINALNPPADPAALARLFDDEARVAPESLAGWSLPTLVVAGGRDQLFPAPVLRRVAEAIPGAEWALLPEVGHSTYFEDPERFNALVEAFASASRP